MHIDEMTRICGFFNSQTTVNNHYGCNHADCEETELVKVDKNGNHYRCEEKLERQITLIALRKKYGSWAEIMKAYETVEGKTYLAEIKHNKIYDPDFVAQFGCKIQGKCYSWSCPFGNKADEEDIFENGENPEDYSDGDWLVIDN